jgi:hypothetical protein
MAEKQTVERARKDKREGKAAPTSRCLMRRKRKMYFASLRFGPLTGLASLLLLGCTVLIFGCTRTKSLSWQDTSENELGFRIYRVSGQTKTLVGEVAPNVTRFTDQDAPSDACYIVTAFNAAGESAPSNISCGGSPQRTAARE